MLKGGIIYRGSNVTWWLDLFSVHSLGQIALLVEELTKNSGSLSENCCPIFHVFSHIISLIEIPQICDVCTVFYVRVLWVLWLEILMNFFIFRLAVLKGAFLPMLSLTWIGPHSIVAAVSGSIWLSISIIYMY